METKFNVWTIEEFNLLGTQLHKDMSFSEAVDNIEQNEISYFYVSMCKDDVISAVEAEKEIADLLKLHYIYVPDFSMYITTY